MLPPRSLIPALFLGAAVVFSVFYIAFLRKKIIVSELLPSGLGGNITETRLLSYLEWVTAGVIARAWSLRLSVISLGLGLILLPIGFVNLSDNIGTVLGAVAAGLLVLWILGEVYLAVYIARKGKPPRLMDMFSARPLFANEIPDLPPWPPWPPATEATGYDPEPLQGERLTATDRSMRPEPAAPQHGAAKDPPAAPQHGAAKDPPAAPQHGAAKDPPAAPQHGAAKDPPAAPQHGTGKCPAPLTGGSTADGTISKTGARRSASKHQCRAGRCARVSPAQWPILWPSCGPRAAGTAEGNVGDPLGAGPCWPAGQRRNSASWAAGSAP